MEGIDFYQENGELKIFAALVNLATELQPAKTKPARNTRQQSDLK